MQSLTTMQSITTPTSNQQINSSGGIQYELLWQKDYLAIYHAKEWNFLKVIWFGLPVKSQIMEGAEKILEFVKQFGCTKAINDVSRVEGMFTDTVDWVITDFSPRLNANGITHVAWIYTEDSVSRYSADAVVGRSITDTITFVFDNVTSAERWILAALKSV